MRKTIAIYILACGMLCAGCADIGGMKEAASDMRTASVIMQQELAKAAEAKATVDADIATMPPGSGRVRAEAISQHYGEYIATGQEWLNFASGELEKFDERIAETKTTDEVVGAVIETAEPYIPAPWGQIALTLFGSYMTYRSYRNKQNGQRAVRSVQPAVDAYIDGDETRAATLRSKQYPATQAFIDGAQRKRFSLPL